MLSDDRDESSHSLSEDEVFDDISNSLSLTSNGIPPEHATME